MNKSSGVISKDFDLQSDSCDQFNSLKVAE